MYCFHSCLVVTATSCWWKDGKRTAPHGINKMGTHFHSAGTDRVKDIEITLKNCIPLTEQSPWMHEASLAYSVFIESHHSRMSNRHQ